LRAGFPSTCWASDVGVARSPSCFSARLSILGCLPGTRCTRARFFFCRFR
jgi:hypothetical protein